MRRIGVLGSGRLLIASVVFGIVVTCCGRPALAVDWWPFGHKGERYTIAIEGVSDRRLKNYLKENGLPPAAREHPPKTAAEVGYLGATMAERYRKSLIARGYYDAKVGMKAEGEKPVRLHFSVAPGTRYLISGWRLQWKGRALALPDDPGLPPEKGRPATADALNAAGARLQDALLKKHCLLDLTIEATAEIDPPSHTVTGVYAITPGPSANFGPTTITGNGRVSLGVVKKSIKWKEGECYQATKLADARTALVQSQLFASANTTAAKVPDANGEAPVTVALNERARHSVSVGANYSTDEGYGITGHWEDRNVAGEAEKLTADAAISELQYSLGTAYSIPYFYRDDQKLTLGANIARETTDAYDSTNATLSATVERKLRDHLTAGLGFGERTTNVSQFGDRRSYELFFIPAFLEWDNRDGTLDPRRGVLSRLSVSPYQDITGKGVSFVKSQLNAQTYVSFDTALEPTLALRGAIGNITGNSVFDVPPDLRFYAGGGGSVRGYAYQALGPRIDNQPVGGKSWTEISGELRVKFTETLGAATFIDGGNVYDDAVPRLDEKLYYGAGAGLRYYSPIGPLRFDVAVPLNRREGDSAYEIYVSVGQAF